MPKISEFDRKALADLLATQHGVVARSQAIACGMSLDVVKYRSRVGGPWRPLLPGVYLGHTGSPTHDQRDMAALLYAGPGSALTGPAALRRHGLKAPQTGLVDVLVPSNTRRHDAAFVRLHRTYRLPGLTYLVGELCFAPPARAVADAVRGLRELSDVRAVVAAAVQQGKCTVTHLAEELNDGSMRFSAQFRRALAEVADGIRSSAEGDLRDLITDAQLPMPMFNPRLFVGSAFLASPDCWWPGTGVAIEVDSREWHLSPEDWERTLARHVRMSAYGIIVLHFTPAQIRHNRAEVTAAIRSALDAARNRPLPQIRALPAS